VHTQPTQSTREILYQALREAGVGALVSREKLRAMVEAEHTPRQMYRGDDRPGALNRRIRRGETNSSMGKTTSNRLRAILRDLDGRGFIARRGDDHVEVLALPPVDTPAIAPIAPGTVTAVEIVAPGEMADQWIVLDRIEPGVIPEYCTHGRATCGVCQEWVWLGHASHDVVKTRQAAPLCMQCANQYGDPSKISNHVQDHRRADGPHP
jgi:hypothetical protein